MIDLTLAQARALRVVATHPDLLPGVPCSRRTDEVAPVVNEGAARALARAGYVTLSGVRPWARITTAGRRAAAALDHMDASCAPGA